MPEIHDILEKIGLTKGESKVYLALLEIGSTTTGKIIEKAEVSASKVYLILDKLIGKGIVSYILKEKTKVYTAQDPHFLIDFLDEKEKIIKENKEAIKDILPQLMLKKESGAPEPVAQVLEGEKGFELVHDKLIDELEKGEKYYTLTTSTVGKTFFHYFDKFNKRRQAKNISMWIIYQKEAWGLGKKKDMERKERKRYFPRICPEEVFVPTHITITKSGCLLCMISDKIISVLIRNKSIIEGYKKYFQYVWKISKTPQGYSEYKEKLF